MTPDQTLDIILTFSAGYNPGPDPGAGAVRVLNLVLTRAIGDAIPVQIVFNAPETLAGNW
jgi:hypothetical protein